MFAKLAYGGLFILFTCSFGNCTLPPLPNSAITGTLKRLSLILCIMKFNSIGFFFNDDTSFNFEEPLY